MEEPGALKLVSTPQKKRKAFESPVIRRFEGENESEIVELWNRCLIRDPITIDIFRRKILLDENFDPRGSLVASCEGDIMGFSLAIRRRHPYYGAGLEEGTGWITVFFVHPEFRRAGIAAALINASEDFLREAGVNEAYVSSYTPNYFAPGVDLDAYAEGYSLLKKLGYRKYERAYSMERSLLDFEYPQEADEVCKSLESKGIYLRIFEPKYIPGLLDFLAANYPGDLFRVALEQLKREPNTDQILVAVKNGSVVGFSHYEDEHFGPFAIDQSLSGMGVGTCLYYKTALYMKEKGKRNLWLGWASGHAKDFYYKRGLKVTRRYEIMKKELK